MAVLELKKIFCGYGRDDIIKGISLTVRPGEILSLAGPNGCGKTTLLKAACGLIHIKSGGAYINGKLISAIPVKERARLIAMLSQTGAGGEYPDYTVRETIMMGRYARHNGNLFSEASPEDSEIAGKFIEETGLVGLEDRLITELSGGQLQRVFLARAFVQEPEILFLDEPANHLDLKHQTELYELLRRWTKSGRSVVVVFHNLNIAAAVSDRIMLMHEGNSVICGSPQEVLSSGKLNEVYGMDIVSYMKKISALWQGGEDQQNGGSDRK